MTSGVCESQLGRSTDQGSKGRFAGKGAFAPLQIRLKTASGLKKLTVLCMRDYSLWHPALLTQTFHFKGRGQLEVVGMSMDCV